MSQYNHNIKVHIEIETGMGRTGVNPSKILEYLESLSNNIIVQGIYTHLSSADSDDEFTKKQLRLFESVVKQIKGKIDLKYIHVRSFKCYFELSRMQI